MSRGRALDVLRQAWEYSVLTAGLLTALPPLTVALLAPFSGRAAAKIGFRPFVIAGPIIVASATLAFVVLLDTDRAPLTFVLISEVVSVGIACFIPVNSAAAVAELQPHRLSIGGAVNDTFRQVGAVLGIAMLVAFIGSPGNARRTRLGSRAGLDHDRHARRSHRRDRPCPASPASTHQPTPCGFSSASSPQPMSERPNRLILHVPRVIAGFVGAVAALTTALKAGTRPAH